MTPLPDPLASILRSDATAAIAALMIIANAHKEIFAWAARMIGSEPPRPASQARPKPEVAATPKKSRRCSTGDGNYADPMQKASARKPAGGSAYHARRREARDEMDKALIEAMRADPDATIGEWATAVGRSKTSISFGLVRLRDAGKAESAEGKWRLVEPEAPKDPPPKWIAPLRGNDRAAHHHVT